jgi:hypothetical protein
MAEGRQRDTWMQTASIISMIANANRDPKKSRPYTWKDFFPFSPPKVNKRNAPKVPLTVLRGVFVNNKVPAQYSVPVRNT